jgi:hypothetical protein
MITHFGGSIGAWMQSDDPGGNLDQVGAECAQNHPAH